MVTIRFWFLDINYQVVGKEPRIMIWGISERGERILILDKTFRPYFYVLPKENIDVNKLILKIKKLSKPRSPITSIEIVEKKYFGKPVKVLKVKTVIPDQVPKYREEIKKMPEVEKVLEADIRFSMRYLIDYQLQPSAWHEAEVEEILVKTPNLKVDKVYELKAPIKPIRLVKEPKLRKIAFDIECYNPHGAPSPERDPVIIISIYNDEGELIQFSAIDKNDKNALMKFVKYVQEYDPDIIMGYNSNRFDWPYLINRGKRVGVKIAISRSGGEPNPSVYGHISVMGRANIDLYDFAEEITEVKVKTLENVADYLGVMAKGKRTMINWWEIPKYWDDIGKRKIFLKYAADDVISTYGLGEKFLPFAIQLSSITGLPLDQVGAASVGFRVEWFLMREAYKANELIPNKVERPYEPYKGAIVLEPKKGVHENIAVLDFSAMYPNIMIKYNISPDTYVPPTENIDPDKVWKAPEIGHRFRKEPPGFFKKVLQMLLSLRKKVREEMKKYPVNSVEYRILDERQKALKILANAMYGYQGWIGARWYCKQAAEAITAWGRQTIKRAMEMARKLGLEVIYGDTDSIFVKYDEEKVKKLIKMVKDELGFEIKIDKVYKRVFFTEAKKRYAGLLPDGRIDIVGFEAIRGDWSELAKDVQEAVMEIILKEGSTEKAVDYVRSIVSDLREKKIPINKLIIWKTISKRLEEYEVEAPHVAAARKIIEKGGKVTVGSKIGYIITKGMGRLSDRATPYFMAKIDDIDVNYYIDRQVIPAAVRVLEYFGITEKELKAVTVKAQKTLFDFFGG